MREDGTVKVLDFGLAKAIAGDGAKDLADSPTVTAMATATGVSLGTAAYMSPEQTKGKTVDRRTDVWAFGCVRGPKGFPRFGCSPLAQKEGRHGSSVTRLGAIG